MTIAVSVVCNQVIPYRIPVFDELGALADIDLTVNYLSHAEKNRQWKVDRRLHHKHLFLASKSTYVTSRDWPVHLQWGLSKALDEQAPDVIVTMGYDSPGFWRAAAWAEQHGARRVLYFGSTLFSSRSTGALASHLRRRFIENTDAFLAYGSWARDYLIHLGARWEDIFSTVNTVDVESIARMTEAATPIERASSHEILYVGQLIERKGVDVLLRGLARLPHQDWRLHIVGTGDQESRLRRLAQRTGIGDRVVFHGYRQSADLGPLFAGCDMLVMPSHREVWGLVVNEALAAGLFVICGKNAGCVPDLIQHGTNGYTVDTQDPAHMAKVLQLAMYNAKNRSAIQSTVLSHTPENTAYRLARAIVHAANKNSPQGLAQAPHSLRERSAA